MFSKIRRIGIPAVFVANDHQYALFVQFHIFHNIMHHAHHIY